MTPWFFLDEKSDKNDVDLEAFLQAEDILSNHPLDDFSEQKEIKFPKVNLSHHGPNFVLDKPLFTHFYSTVRAVLKIYTILLLTANIFESGPIPTPWKFLVGLPLLSSCKLG